MKSMGFVDAVKSVLVENYANFKGRARRSEYWYFVLFNVLLNIVLLGLFFIVPEVVFLSVLVGLALIIPSLAVVVRRFHDIGKSGWNIAWVLLSVISIANLVVAILFLIWFCRDSQPGENKWGANPKE